MAISTEQRLVNGIEVPPAGTYTFDPAHTTVEFVGTHMFTKTRGRFTRAEGTIVIGEDPADSAVEVTIDAASLQSNNGQRDEHLKSPDFLNVETYPEIRFRSTAFRPGAGRDFELDGELTIKDITKPLTLRGEFGGHAENPFGKTSVGFTASTRFPRADWDMTWNMALEAGGFLVGKDVTVEIEVEALRQD
jgi:polyisoprenoid-binding protein YceI